MNFVGGAMLRESVMSFESVMREVLDVLFIVAPIPVNLIIVELQK